MRAQMTDMEALEEKDIERIQNMTLGDMVQELGLSLWEWLGELAFRLSEYADYSYLEPPIPPARVIRRTPIELKEEGILTVDSLLGGGVVEVGEGSRRRRGSLVGHLVAFMRRVSNHRYRSTR